ncbi:GNAT family N-acetyltransferase [Bacillus sp. ISL-41]|uniref:GNAT family N-acetyltransferase n=1 Tax=Bacillus sp. ISL-41 TaxID=2819127 RepID=UPI001BE653FC|nr:GNAT family protein [Bacillus sp. ISL-41]MBT2642928.1 GNAT family N-acetyltransferase [Bacillus sp. ISL-41]
MKNNSKPVRLLIGDRLYLRPLSLEDTETYFQQLFDPEVRRLTGTTRAFTKEGIQRYIEAKSQDISSVLLLIALKDTDQVIGDIALQDIDPINRNCNIRIAIESEYQGKGYGSEVMPLMLDYGFGILNMHRIELEVFAYNPRAIHVYEKLGFKQEGIQRDYLYYNHKYHDCIKMSILEDEFRELYVK